MKRKDFLKGLGLLGGGVILSKMAKPLEVDAAVTDNMNDSNGIKDTKNDTTAFTSSDDATIFNSGNLGGQSSYNWNAVSKLTSGEKHSSIFHKVSLMFKNIRTLAKLIGTTDISKIGNGTVTGAISNINTDLSAVPKIDVVVSSAIASLSSGDTTFPWYCIIPITYPSDRTIVSSHITRLGNDATYGGAIQSAGVYAGTILGDGRKITHVLVMSTVYQTCRINVAYTYTKN